MKTPTLFLVLCLALNSVVLAEESRDLIVVAGQSNAVGFDALTESLPADPADAKVLFRWRCGDPPPDDHDSAGDATWVTLRPQPLGKPLTKAIAAAMVPPHPDAARQYGNFAGAGGGFGPEIGLARTLAAKESRPLAILKVAFSGTSLAKDWGPDAKEPEGACYRALLAEFKIATEAARKAEIDLRPRALVWVQGESDANAEAAPLYEDRLAAMLEDLRRDLAAPDLVLLIAVNTRFGNGKNPHMPTIVAAQRSLAERLERCAYVDTAGAETLPPSHTHFTAAGTLEVGERFAEALHAEEAALEKR